MGSLVSARTNAHFYYPDGSPCYEVEMKTKPGQMRPATIADARKLNLLPSVTNVISLLNREMLNAWRIEQAIWSAIRLPRFGGESEDDFARRIVIDADSQTERARVIGSELHEACERYVTLRELPGDPVIARLFEPTRKWWDENCEEAYYCETPVVGDGYAGRVDCKAKLRGIGTAIIDFKGRKYGKDGKAGTYDEDCLQLSAYRIADSITRPCADKCVSLLINNVPEQEPALTVHVWSDDDCDRYYAAFLAIKQAWCLLKRYSPPSR